MSQALALSAPASPAPGLHARGAQTYFHTHVQSRSPIELVVLMYDAGLRFLVQARTAMTDHDLVAKRHALSRGMAIISELQSMLNMEAGGAFAERLDALYTYINGRCLAANSERNPAGLDEAIRLLGTLRSGWAELAAASPSAA